jgi:acetolactate synthase-1/2/3 large subunit
METNLRTRMQTGGQVAAYTLHELGVDAIYSVSGNQVLSVFDAAIDFDLHIIHMRHESAAAYAAGVSAEVTEMPGVVLVTAGPGFLAATLGVATIKSMELPLLFLSGASATSDAGAGGFQDLDQAAVAQVTCKATMRVTSVREIRKTLIEAWRLAQSSIPGPVHVSLPSDILLAEGPDMLSIQNEAPPPDPAFRDESIIHGMALKLMGAKRPFILARQSASRGAAGRALRTLALQLGTTAIISESPRGLSDLKYRGFISRLRDCDCLLAISPADFAVGFLAESVIAPSCKLLHIDAPGDPKPRRPVELHTQVAPDLALSYLANVTASHRPRLSSLGQLETLPQSTDTSTLSSKDGLHPLEVARLVRAVLEPDDIVVLDGGEFCQWIRLGLHDVPNRMIWNSKLGGIGGSIPMAVGIASTPHRGRTIVFVGDGSFGYHGSELETAARYALPLVVIVGNDRRWGAEWHLQISRYGGDRTYETELSGARYDRVASGFGALGFHVADSASLQEALLVSLGQSKPACLNVQVLSLQSPAVAP